MAPDEFWASTPRELQAHSKVAEQEREFISRIYAGLQSTLHQAHWPQRGGWPADGFLGKRKEDAVPQWKRDLAAARAALVVVKRPDAEAAKETIDYFSDRTKRASEAKRRGEPREVIDRIMTGAA